MITSAAGLVVGIFAYVGYHILSMMVDSVVGKMEWRTYFGFEPYHQTCSNLPAPSTP